MKALILCATKYGATQEIANRIASRLDDATILDLSKNSDPDLCDYECVIVGSAIYAGMIRKEAKAFLVQNTEALQGKRIGIFLSGLDPSKEDEVYEANFEAELLGTIKAKSHLGGLFDPKKTNLAERLVMKAAAGQSGYQDAIDDEKITRFVEELVDQ
jgi:menaquinone-dependent protoporphyrinogen oxidase